MTANFNSNYDKPFNCQVGDTIVLRRFKADTELHEAKVVKRDAKRISVMIDDETFKGLWECHVSLVEVILEHNPEKFARQNRIMVKKLTKKFHAPAENSNAVINNPKPISNNGFDIDMDVLAEEIRRREEFKNSPEGKALQAKLDAAYKERELRKAEKLAKHKASKGKKPTQKGKIKSRVNAVSKSTTLFLSR